MEEQSCHLILGIQQEKNLQGAAEFFQGVIMPSGEGSVYNSRTENHSKITDFKITAGKLTFKKVDYGISVKSCSFTQKIDENTWVGGYACDGNGNTTGISECHIIPIPVSSIPASFGKKFKF